MATSVNDLKKRLRVFLADPQSNQDFRVWFAHTLREASAGDGSDLESLAHAIQRAFSDAAYGLYSPEQLRSVLSLLLSQEPIAVNEMIFLSPSAFIQPVNRLMEGIPFREATVFSDTSPSVEFGSIMSHPS